MKIPLIYNIRSVLHRPATSLATALGVAFVVLTFVGMLALANGFRAALIATGRPDNVFLLRKGADGEISSGISRDQAAIVRSYPEIARSPDGLPIATADVYVVVSNGAGTVTSSRPPGFSRDLRARRVAPSSSMCSSTLRATTVSSSIRRRSSTGTLHKSSSRTRTLGRRPKRPAPQRRFAGISCDSFHSPHGHQQLRPIWVVEVVDRQLPLDPAHDSVLRDGLRHAGSRSVGQPVEDVSGAIDRAGRPGGRRGRREDDWSPEPERQEQEQVEAFHGEG